MKTYIAMLRGINVSGQKKIKMADLREQMVGLGLSDVKTYIQSGNIVFNATNATESDLENAIETKILADYGFQVPTIVRTPVDFEAVLANNPFLNDPAKDPKRFYITFISAPPASEAVEKLAAIDHSPEEYVITAKHIYFFSPQGYGRAKMNNNYFEKKLKVGATTRNWRTVHKLLEMGKEASLLI